MEIEAKFAVPTPRHARQLRALIRGGEFTLSAPKRVTMRDTFFDTQVNDLGKARYVLRVRRQSDGRTLLTCKTPTQRKGAIHTRPEIEAEITLPRTPRVLMLSALPRNIQSVIAPLVQERKLLPLFSISQTREIRAVRRARRIVAEWSLDRVTFRVGKRKRAFYELEIELKKGGRQQELEELARKVREDWELLPQTKGKFERAAEFMRGRQARRQV